MTSAISDYFARMAIAAPPPIDEFVRAHPTTDLAKGVVAAAFDTTRLVRPTYLHLTIEDGGNGVRHCGRSYYLPTAPLDPAVFVLLLTRLAEHGCLPEERAADPTYVVATLVALIARAVQNPRPDDEAYVVRLLEGVRHVVPGMLGGAVSVQTTADHVAVSEMTWYVADVAAARAALHENT